MDVPLFPWWLMLLVGMWAVAITFWLHPASHREIRMWAGLSTLVYLGLIFLALRVVPQTQSSDHLSANDTRSTSPQQIGLAICVMTSLTASVWLLGPVSPRRKRICYLIVTLANAIVCFMVQQPEAALGLLIVAWIAVKPIVFAWSAPHRRPSIQWLMGFTRFHHKPVGTERRGEYLLIGLLCGILTLTILGTISNGLKNETSQSATRFQPTNQTTLEKLDVHIATTNNSSSKITLIDFALETRSDLIVLMAVIVFLSLAMSPINSSDAKNQNRVNYQWRIGKHSAEIDP